MTAIRVLVVYGTKNGSTAEIAEWTAEALRDRGVEADARSAADDPDPGSYDAVIVGAGLYAGRWRRDAARFVRRHQKQLGRQPVWLFSSGPLDDSAAVGDLPAPAGVVRLADRIDARTHIIFGGRLNDGARGFIARQILRQGRGGDFRDRARIREWAHAVADELLRTGADNLTD
ncbi:flavodoxin domain-containing protein [Actinacidiphila alni]|uniref:flavodoxin domain-containing protein n=1 Tax=Actinacidiphila alni TaxID=380248 RepID=UPI0033CCEDC3